MVCGDHWFSQTLDFPTQSSNHAHTHMREVQLPDHTLDELDLVAEVFSLNGAGDVEQEGDVHLVVAR